jgi:glycosyltransferase involved in cell wall biosynthesis
MEYFSEMNNKRISIITATYNSQETIRDTIESVINQKYNNIEYIIIDGASTDSTLDLIRSYEENFKKALIDFRYVSEPDNGIYDAMNKGIRMATGEWIGILNSDDWYNDSAVSELVKIQVKNEFSIISANMNKVDKNKKILKVLYNKKNLPKYIRRTMPINHPATFVNRSVYDKIGNYNCEYRLSADYDLILRAYNTGVHFIFMDTILVNMRNTGATHQLNNIFVTAKEDYAIRKAHFIKGAQIYYFLRIGFNFLVIIREIYRKITLKRMHL